MSPESCDFAFAWLNKAYSDLAAAKVLIQGESKLLDIGCYHCQQSAEKSLKGWLTAQEAVFPKTHQLTTILDICIPLESKFNRFQTHAQSLSPFATEYRYPGDDFEPAPEEANEALSFAEEIYDFCKHAIQKAVNQ